MLLLLSLSFVVGVVVVAALLPFFLIDDQKKTSRRVKFEKAKACFEKAMETNPNNKYTLRNYAQVHKPHNFVFFSRQFLICCRQRNELASGTTRSTVVFSLFFYLTCFIIITTAIATAIIFIGIRVVYREMKNVHLVAL